MQRRKPDKPLQPGHRSQPQTKPSSLAPLQVTITPSTHYTTFIVCLHALSMIALCQTAYLPKSLLLPLLLLIVNSTIVATYHSREHSTLKWLSDEQLQWSVAYRALHQHQHWRHSSFQCFCGSLSARSVHCSLFILLELTDVAGKHRHCLIPKDAVSTADFRRLRARLYLRERVTA